MRMMEMRMRLRKRSGMRWGMGNDAWVRGMGVVGVGAALALGGASSVGALTPEADLAYHGSVTMAAGLVDLRLTPQNHGPSTVEDATVRLRWSAPLADAQRLPDDCARSGERAVVCRTGPLAADVLGDEIRLKVRLRGEPSEVTLEIDTVWGGGAVDRNHGNDEQRVLVLDTGDSYVF